MSVSRTTTSSNAEASSRLTRAIEASRPLATPASTGGSDGGVDADGGSTSDFVAPKRSVAASIKALASAAVADGARGAKAAPDAAETGSTAAATGAAMVMGAGQPGTVAASAPPPSEVAPDPVPIDAQPGTDPALAGDPTAAPARSNEPITGSATGAWTPQWQARFEQLRLAPSDIQYLAAAGYSDTDLNDIATQLEQVALLDPGATAGGQVLTAPTPGVDAGSVASANGPLPQDVAAQQAAQASAWSPEWEQRFTELLRRVGLPTSEITAQLQAVQGQPLTEEQLQTAYQNMSASVGDFTPQWRAKFIKVMTELKTPKAEQDQVLLQLAGSGLTEARLTQAYEEMVATKPAWNQEYETKFKTLDLPKDLLEQLKDSGAPKAALDQQFQSLLDTKLKYKNDGRLEKLQEASATPEEKWHVMTQDLSGKAFDKEVEKIRSQHVPFWKHALSFGVNLIPGVYALQYLTGKDWITQNKIDRTNPLNILGAVASGFAGFTAIRSGIQTIQGISALGRAGAATMQAAQGAKTLGDAVNVLGNASPLAKGAFQAVEAANLVNKVQSGFKVMDYVKAVLPGVNRFGEAGRIAAVGRGYFQGMQLAAGSAALTAAAEGGKVGVDAATKSVVFSELRKGSSIQQALATAGRGTGDAAKFALSADDIVRGYTSTGFLQGSVGKAVDGSRFLRGNGNYRFTPFKNHATVATTNNPNVFSLGRNVNFGTNGGLAQGIGLVQGASATRNAGLSAKAVRDGAALLGNTLLDARPASSMAGVNIADDVQRVATMSKTAEWAKKLGVYGESPFRTLMQLGPSNRTAARVAGMVTRGGEQGYRAGRFTLDLAQRAGNFSLGPIVGGAAFGMTGTYMQPMWEYAKDHKNIQAQEAKQREVAEQESKDLERLYAEQQAATAGGGTSVPAAGGATAPAAGAGGVQVGTANGDIYDPTTGQLAGTALPATDPTPATAATPAASQVYVDQATGMYVDPQTGLRADPASGQVFDAHGAVVGNIHQPAA